MPLGAGAFARYPSEAVIYGIEGHVVVESRLSGADGEVSECQRCADVARPSLSEAALFVVRRSPRWELES
ncbi:MAG: energy transducer TonB [Alistipes onderdonkii]